MQQVLIVSELVFAVVHAAQRSRQRMRNLMRNLIAYLRLATRLKRARRVGVCGKDTRRSGNYVEL